MLRKEEHCITIRYTIYFGFGNANFPSKLGVWDIRNKSFVSLIDFSSTPISNQEPEDICAYENNLYLVTANKNVYKLEF